MDVPSTIHHDAVIQNGTMVNYLQFTGPTLTASFTANYPGIAGWNVVASGFFDVANPGRPDLVVQNATTGQLDILLLSANGQALVGTILGPVVPPVHGSGTFGFVANEIGNTLVSQLPNGQIDLLAINAAGQLIRSDLIPGTVGLPPIVGVGESIQNFPIIQGVGPVGGANDSIVVQYPNGLLDVLGFTGDFGLAGGVAFTNSFALPATAGSPPVFAIDQDFNFAGRDANTPDLPFPFTIQESVGMVGQLANGQVDHLFFNSGYNTPAADRGVEFATLADNMTVPTGWRIVDAGLVAHTDFFPVVT